LDVHANSIDVTAAETGAGREVRHVGSIGGDLASLDRVLRRLRSDGAKLHVVYEAGPCGFVIARHLREQAIDCEVVAPSMIPRRPGERIKTDRRDSVKLARLARAGELTPVHLPEQADEAMRDLSRAREDAIRAQRAARHQLKALLLRNGIRYAAKSAWTAGHRRWIARLKLPDPVQQIVFQDYVNAVEEATRRVASLSEVLEAQVKHWPRAPLVRAYEALRGVQLVNAVCLAAELGDLRRFANARELMAFVGLVPSEHSSGENRRQGRITKTGNAHARRALIEAAWHYRLPARVTPIIARRWDGLPRSVTDIAWKAQLRLCARYRRLAARRLLAQKVVVAIARELVGFVWAIGQIVESRTETAQRSTSTITRSLTG